MSSLEEDEGSVSRTGFDPELGQRNYPLGFALGLLQNREGEVERQGEGEDCFPHPEGFVGNEHVMEVAGQVAQGWEGRVGSAAGSAAEEATWTSFGSRIAVPLSQRPTKRDGWGFPRSPFTESSDREVSTTVWLEPEPGPRGTGTGAHGWMGSQVSPGVSFHFRGPEGDGTWGSPKPGVRDRSQGSVGGHHAFEEGLDRLSWSESELSDESSEMQLVRRSICQEGGGWAKAQSLSATHSPWSSRAREKSHPMLGSCLCFPPETLSPGEAGQAVRDVEVSSDKTRRVTRRNAGRRPSYLPLVPAAGGLPQAHPRRKVAQKERSLQGPSEAVLEGFFHLPGQRGSGAPQDPASAPWIGGVPLFGLGMCPVLSPIGTRESKPTDAGQVSVAQRNSGSKRVVGGDDQEPGREPFPEHQSLTQGQRLSFPCGHRGPRGTGTVSNRHAQDPAGSEPLALSDEGVLASGPAPSSDLEPPEELPRPERLQLLHGTVTCPAVEELQRGLRALRKQLAAMQSLIEKLLRY